MMYNDSYGVLCFLTTVEGGIELWTSRCNPEGYAIAEIADTWTMHKVNAVNVVVKTL